MKKQILELGKRLNKEVQQQIKGGAMAQPKCPPGQSPNPANDMKCEKNQDLPSGGY